MRASLQIEGDLKEGLVERKARRRRLINLWRLAKKKPLGTFSLLLLLVLWSSCILAPLLAPYEWNATFTGPRLEAPTFDHFFGTDQVGEDVFSRMLYGGRLTLTVGLLATIAAISLSTLMGIVSGYFLGLFDLLFQRVSDAIQAMPGLIILLMIGAVFNASLPVVMAALVVLTTPVTGRIIRSATLSIRGTAYIEAAQVIGATPTRILWRHVLPNLFPVVIVLFSVWMGTNLLLSASLSFLGVINSTYPDWGAMLNASVQSYMVPAPWLAIVPGLAITLAVLAYNLLGDALRDILDPRLRMQ